jgi:uncharacterized membrane protein YtjA (UPF0391 family)
MSSLRVQTAAFRTPDARKGFLDGPVCPAVAPLWRRAAALIISIHSPERSKPAGVYSGERVQRKEIAMLGWALTFLVIAIIAAIFGFGGIASASAGIAQILFFLFLVAFVVSLVMHMVRRT